MEYISREQFNQSVENKGKINADDLVYVLEEKFGYTVSLEKKQRLSDEQKKRMTDYIFSNEDILEQLNKASISRDYIYDDEKALKIIQEARDGE